MFGKKLRRIEREMLLMKYIKYMPYQSIKNASRNRREIEVSLELGYDVTIFSNDDLKSVVIGNYEARVINDGNVKLNYGIPSWKRKIFVVRNSVNDIRQLLKLEYDVISCHNIGSLMRAYVTNKIRKSKAILIYDSHEFELGRNIKRSKLQYQLVKKCEGFLMRRCAFSIMVNDVIADEVQKIHKLKERPVVVRSIPNYWTIDEGACKATRQELLALMTKPKDTMLMYHGIVMNGRGIETLLRVVAGNPNVCAVILGNGEESYLSMLKAQTDKLGITPRVLFHDAVAIEELRKYVGAADIGMVLAPAIVKNHLYMLPNKFFENIQSETPVICPSYPAMKPIVDKYEIGLTCDPENVDEINECIEKFRKDKVLYQRCKEKLKIAKRELCWENEKKVLIEAYKKYL